jgi:hypothetical protein
MHLAVEIKSDSSNPVVKARFHTSLCSRSKSAAKANLIGLERLSWRARRLCADSSVDVEEEASIVTRRMWGKIEIKNASGERLFAADLPTFGVHNSFQEVTSGNRQ